MSPWRQSLEVARWEFRRLIKPKQLFVSFLITVVAGVVGFGLARLANRQTKPATVAVIGDTRLGLSLRDTTPGSNRLRLVAHEPRSVDSLRGEVAARRLDGLLLIADRDHAELVVARDPLWRSELESRLASARQAIMLRESGIDPDDLTRALAPVQVRTTFLATDRGGSRARAVAMIAAGLVLYGVFTASALMFVSVTGEKQLRVTEQVLSSISPQSWMDGKILGVAAATIVSMVTTLLAVIVFIVGRWIARGSVDLSALVSSPSHLVMTLIFTVLGFAFWLAFLGGIAATVDDPNTSTRGPLLFVPAMFSTVAFMIVRHPDSLFARIMSIFPASASAVMPARLAVTDVPWWETTLSLVLLLGGAWMLRRAAGRIFAVAMLLYGKEPTWGEIRRLARKSV
jgi:ABC-2 type transport system permease protein